MAQEPLVPQELPDFIVELRMAQLVEVYYLDEEGTSQVLAFRPHKADFHIGDSLVVYPVEDGCLEGAVIQLDKMLVAKLFYCKGCDRCNGEGAGALWFTALQGSLLFKLPWGAVEE